jgi:pSer/pThr/pTyr-binding forkhead associated (FHA) protein
MRNQIVLQELGSLTKYRINLPCVVGRSHEADLTFTDPSISHRHARISEIDDQIWIEDLKSSNGVYVNGRKIKEKIPLRPGDSVQLGQTDLLVCQEQEAISGQTIVLHSLDPKAEWKLDHERLRLIYGITTALSENQDVTVLGERIFSKFKEIFRHDRGYLALFQEDGTLRPIFLDSSSQSVPLSRSIVNRLFQTGESCLLEDALSETSLKEQESVVTLRIRSALCVPLVYHDQIYGLIYLDRRIPGAYRQDDLEFLRAIATILAPLIENARLWSELRSQYASAMETLKKAQARLIDMERKAAYVRLAQALAHEIRNPLMAIGGFVRRVAQSEPQTSEGVKFRAIMPVVERVEAVLREVDDFVRLPLPRKKLERIDSLIQEAVESQDWGLCPVLCVKTPHLMIPLDADLFKKALSMIFREIVPGIPQGSEFKILIQHSGIELEILIGEIAENGRFFEPFDPELQRKPWSLGLFLNIAHRIISDHGGKLLLDPEGHSAFPMLIRIPRGIQL